MYSARVSIVVVCLLFTDLDLTIQGARPATTLVDHRSLSLVLHKLEKSCFAEFPANFANFVPHACAVVAESGRLTAPKSFFLHITGLPLYMSTVIEAFKPNYLGGHTPACCLNGKSFGWSSELAASRAQTNWFPCRLEAIPGSPSISCLEFDQPNVSSLRTACECLGT